MFLLIINNYLPLLLYSEKIIYCWSEIGTIYGILTYGILILKPYFNLWYVQQKRTSRTCFAKSNHSKFSVLLCSRFHSRVLTCCISERVPLLSNIIK